MVVADPLQGLILVSGPSRGGKSRWAEHLVKRCSCVSYIATSAARPEDASWQERLRLHRERRPSDWNVVESGPDLVSALASVPSHHTLLVDALGAFTAAHLDCSADEWSLMETALITALRDRVRPVVMVVEETGWGVVPATVIGGLFRDRQGRLAQQLEHCAAQSWLVVQGRALDLHALGLSVPQ